MLNIYYLYIVLLLNSNMIYLFPLIYSLEKKTIKENLINLLIFNQSLKKL